MGETVKSQEVESKTKANGLATAWYLNKDEHEDIRIYEIYEGHKVRIY